jgi:hypothetical protein
MYGNNVYATIDDESAADYDDESYDDDESYRSSEDFPFGVVRDRRAFPGRAAGIGSFVGGGAPWRTPLSTVSVQPSGTGVSTANLQTPAGNATLRLSEPVPNLEQFRANNQRVESAINGIITRLNSTQGDIAGINQQLASVGFDLRSQIGKLRKDTRRSLDMYRREQKVTLGRLRREQSAQQSNSMLISILLQQQLQKRIDEHTHALPDHTHAAPTTADPTKTGGITSPAPTIPAPAAASNSNNALLFLPLMMMGGMNQDSGDSYSGSNSYSDSSRSSGMDSMLPLFLLLSLNK